MPIDGDGGIEHRSTVATKKHVKMHGKRCRAEAPGKRNAAGRSPHNNVELAGMPDHICCM